MNKIAKETEGQSDFDQMLAYQQALESKHGESDYFSDLAAEEKRESKKAKAEEKYLNRVTIPGSAGHAWRICNEKD